MKKKIWNSVNQDGLTPSKNYLSISNKSKTISISPELIKIMELNANDKVVLIEGENGEWFIAKTDSPDGFTAKSKDNCFILYALSMVNYLSNLWDIEDRKRFEVDTDFTIEDNMKLFKIIIP